MWVEAPIVRLLRDVHVHVSRGIAWFSCKTDWQQDNLCFYNKDLTFAIRKQHAQRLCHMQSLSQPYLQTNDKVTNYTSCLFHIIREKPKMQTAWSTKSIHNKFLNKTYEETISTLNGLQSNAATIVRSQKDPTLIIQNMIQMQGFLKLLAISDEELKSLNIIHVAGTKGKGSTCAFTESILRSSGYKTGFFCSPHLVAVRERIRINGKPLSPSEFVFHFWHVYNKIADNVIINEDKTMPMYFMFLTLMAFHVFLHEKVDVAVLEVGIGGEYDCTNVTRHPKVVGITSIGLDHVSLLGDTLEKIAWQKAGIMKENVPAFTVQQTPGVLSVFLERAVERKCPLYLVPRLNDYDWSRYKLSISADIQEVNISLAFQLANAWIERHETDLKEPCDGTGLRLAPAFEINSAFENGLQNCVWLGRFQKLRKDKMLYFLDGAHTLESIECCSDWFLKSSDMEVVKHDTRRKVYRVLLFNCTRDRKPEVLLFPLSQLYFDLALFCTNNVKSDLVSSSDLTNYNADREKEIQQCQNNMNVWQHFMSCEAEEERFGTKSKTASPGLHSHTIIRYLVSDAIKCLEMPQYSQLNATVKEEIMKADDIHILVTGSLHLVGSVLSIVDPQLQSS